MKKRYTLILDTIKFFCNDINAVNPVDPLLYKIYQLNLGILVRTFHPKCRLRINYIVGTDGKLLVTKMCGTLIWSTV